MSGPAPPVSRRDRERIERRRAMLDAALDVFGEKGYGATLDEVAERAEFGKGTLYNYFPEGKHQLYLALFEEHVLGGMERAVAAAFPDLDAVATPAGVRDAFERLIGGLLAHFEARPSILLLFMRDGHRMLTDPDTRTLLFGRFEQVLDALTRPVEAAMAAGSLRPLPARPVAHMILGTVRGFLLARMDVACPAGASPVAPPPAAALGTPDQAAAFLTTVLFDGLLADRS